jgi:hypothetical protein
MQIFSFTQTTGYEILHPLDEGGFDQFDTLNGQPQGKTWKPMRVERVRATPRQGCKPSDSPFVYSTGAMVFRRSAVDALRDILNAYGELLPLKDAEGVELYAYNPRALDALDHQLTRGARGDDGLVYNAHYHVFFPSVVEGVDIFRLVDEKAGPIYVSRQFVVRWKQAKLKGLDFILAWDSELPPEKQPNVWESKPIKL